MPEAGGANIEIAHHLNEAQEHAASAKHSRSRQIVEVFEALVLAVVAITTAWSGYQSARWDSVQSKLYGESLRLRVESQALAVEANQAKQYDAATVVEWIKAQAHGDTKLADLFERRLLPEFQPAFQAWKKTDPLHDPKAPAAPALMLEYRDIRGEQAAQTNKDADDFFEKGTDARERADEYVRVTVFLATVLLLIALSQRFQSHWIRVVMASVAVLMLCIPVWHLLILPRL